MTLGLASAARNERRRVLIVDLDPQANATAGLNVADVGYTTSDVLYDGRSGLASMPSPPRDGENWSM